MIWCSYYDSITIKKIRKVVGESLIVKRFCWMINKFNKNSQYSIVALRQAQRTSSYN